MATIPTPQIIKTSPNYYELSLPRKSPNPPKLHPAPQVSFHEKHVEFNLWSPPRLQFLSDTFFQLHPAHTATGSSHRQRPHQDTGPSEHPGEGRGVAAAVLLDFFLRQRKCIGMVGELNWGIFFEVMLENKKQSSTAICAKGFCRRVWVVYFL